MDKTVFELIAINKNRNQKIGDKTGLMHYIASYYEFKNSKILTNTVTVDYRNVKIQIQLNESTNLYNEKVFNIIALGEFDIMESFRNAFLNLLKGQFLHLYIVKDEVSKELCKVSYPIINNVENALRQYIMHFMILNIGSEWWKLNVTDAIGSKSDSRDVKSAFSHFDINQEIYHVDFKDLGNFIFHNFSGYKSKNDILRDLNSCKTLDDFNKVKNQSMSNWEKYFQKYFDENWDKDWNELGELRNQIAHNKLIERKTSDKISILGQSLLNTINTALENLKTLEYKKDEIIEIKDQIRIVKNRVVTSAIKKLDDYDYTIDKMSDLIAKLKEEDVKSITTDVIVREICGEYVVGHELNRAIGRIISFFNEDLGLESSGEIIQITDSSGRATTSKEWIISD